MAGTEKVKIKQVLQIGVVVKDLQKAMEHYWNVAGLLQQALLEIRYPIAERLAILKRTLGVK